MQREPVDLDAVAQPHHTVADKIRALAAAGVPRADIARFLGKRYQHVRNVLEGDAQAGGGYVLGRADLSGVGDSGARYRSAGEDAALIEPRGNGAYWIRIRPDGSLPLPDELVEALSAAPGRRVFARLTDHGVKLLSADAAMEEVRAIVRQHAQTGSVVDEFLAERRATWGQDDD
jgi:hypothetical protein